MKAFAVTGMNSIIDTINDADAVPPAAMMGNRGFLLGEPMDHHALSGKPRFCAYLRRGKQYVASDRPITRDEFFALFKPATEATQ